MSISYATVDPTKMELTPMQVLFQGPSILAPVDLGGTLGNVVIETKYMKAEIKADQFGSTVLDRRVSGLNVTVTTEIAQIYDLPTLKIVFPHATVGSATADIVSAIGDSDTANAGILTLHPMSKGSTDVTEDFTFYKACASAESPITYGPDKQSSYKIVWNILPDLTQTPARFYRRGDPAA